MTNDHNEKPATPWRRVFAKFGMSQSDFAAAIGRHRSKVSRALKDEKGLISGSDQERLIAVARKFKVKLAATDLMPGHR